MSTTQYILSWRNFNYQYFSVEKSVLSGAMPQAIAQSGGIRQVDGCILGEEKNHLQFYLQKSEYETSRQ